MSNMMQRAGDGYKEMQQQRLALRCVYYKTL